MAGSIHALAFAFLLGFAANRQPLHKYDDDFWYDKSKFSWRPHVWKFTCAENVTGVHSCSDDDKRFFVEPPAGVTKLNAVALASFYVAWSSLGHFCVWYLQGYHRFFRWLDYSVTAPTMLVVVGIVYGTDSAWLVIMPGLLAILLVLAALVERDETEVTVLKGSKQAWAFYGLVALYLVAIAPTIYAAYMITDESQTPRTDKDDDAVGYGTAPDFVFGFAVFTMALFSSFVVVYAVDLLYVALERREKYYIMLSLIAKTSLHLFLGLTVVETASTVSADKDSTEARSDMETLSVGFGGSAGLILGVILLYNFGRLYDDSVPTALYARVLQNRLV